LYEACDNSGAGYDVRCRSEVSTIKMRMPSWPQATTSAAGFACRSGPIRSMTPFPDQDVGRGVQAPRAATAQQQTGHGLSPIRWQYQPQPSLAPALRARHGPRGAGLSATCSGCKRTRSPRQTAHIKSGYVRGDSRRRIATERVSRFAA
jgi:hypothetical protein